MSHGRSHYQKWWYKTHRHRNKPQVPTRFKEEGEIVKFNKFMYSLIPKVLPNDAPAATDEVRYRLPSLTTEYVRQRFIGIPKYREFFKCIHYSVPHTIYRSLDINCVTLKIMFNASVDASYTFRDNRKLRQISGFPLQSKKQQEEHLNEYQAEVEPFSKQRQSR